MASKYGSTAPPNLQPEQKTSISVLPETGSYSDVSDALPLGIYGTPGQPLYDESFVSGAVDQVKWTFRKLGGDILDIELAPDNIYAAYEEAVLEYSYIVNLHQAENVLSDLLGDSTGSFDEDGNLKPGALSSSLGGDHVQLKYPQFGFSYARRVGEGIGKEAAVGGTQTEYSASIKTEEGKQDYDLQELISNQPEFSGSIGNKRIIISKVFFESPRAAWRFYGYYGGLSTVGNFHNYGQWSDDSTFEVIPVWQNKLQAIQYENALYTRLSHWSYELKGNKIRIYPAPDIIGPDEIWVRFYIPQNNWEREGSLDTGIDGINNINSLPFTNLPFDKINSMGKKWIRDYAHALAMEILGQNRSKFANIPIPNDSVTLNGSELISRATDEQNRLRDELREILERNSYESLTERDANIVNNTKDIWQDVPVPIEVG